MKHGYQPEAGPRPATLTTGSGVRPPIAELAGLRERAAMKLDALAQKHAGDVYGPAYAKAAALVRATPITE